VIGPAMAKKKPSLDAWKPKFDPSGAKYKCVVSNVSYPVLKAVYAGIAIRDELWKRTNGQVYLDYFSLSILGGEVEVLNQISYKAWGMNATAMPWPDVPIALILPKGILGHITSKMSGVARKEVQ